MPIADPTERRARRAGGPRAAEGVGIVGVGCRHSSVDTRFEGLDLGRGTPQIPDLEASTEEWLSCHAEIRMYLFLRLVEVYEHRIKKGY